MFLTVTNSQPSFLVTAVDCSPFYKEFARKNKEKTKAQVITQCNKFT